MGEEWDAWVGVGGHGVSGLSHAVPQRPRPSRALGFGESSFRFPEIFRRFFVHVLCVRLGVHSDFPFAS